ncbi:MAG: carbohydrate ABC transporter permease [Promethearchaeota archaeon]
MITEEYSNEDFTYKDMNKEKIKEIKIPNYDYISLFLILFGFILIIVGFWEIETILWNRIKYTTGSQWSNANPLYLTTPISGKDSIESLLIINLIYYYTGNFLVIISSTIMVFQYILRKSWFKTSKIYLVFSGIISIAAALMGFWLKFSINVIENLEIPLGETKSGYDWIRGEIPFYSRIIEFIGIFFWVSSLVIALVTFYIIFRKWSQRRKKTRENSEISNKSLKNKSISTLKSILQNLPFYLVLLGYLVFTLFPVYLAIMASVSTVREINNGQSPADPLGSMILNYSSVMFTLQKTAPSFRTALFNSLFLGFGTSSLSLAISVTSAYALARLKFKGKSFLSYIILATQMFPAIVLLIPQYVIMSDLGLLEDRVVLLGTLLVMSTGATAYVTWMMKGYFETIPRDIEEAAYIDGYGKFKTFIKIVLPLAKSGMVAVMIFTFLSAWQEFILARTFIGQSDAQHATLPLLFYQYQRLDAPDVPTFFELLSPYAILVATPVVAFYLLLQKQLVGGVVAGAVK